MQFPNWAPPSLIKALREIEDVVRMYQEYAKEDSDEGDLLGCTCESSSPSVVAQEKEKRAEVLRRMLTSIEMERVWSKLVAQQLRSEYDDVEPAGYLWHTVSCALDDFPKILENAEPPEKRRKRLNLLIEHTNALRQEILSSAEARALAAKVPATLLGKKNLQYRLDRGDTPSWGDYMLPLTLATDCSELERNAVDISNDEDAENDKDVKWKKIPLVERLGFWAKQAQEMGLVEQLDLFAEWLNDQKQQPVEVRQPGRGNATLKAFLIRRLYRHMESCYGRAMDDVVARLVSVILDLQSPLDRSDVRPYRMAKREEI